MLEIRIRAKYWRGSKPTGTSGSTGSATQDFDGMSYAGSMLEEVPTEHTEHAE
jgi:hypothetical protein